MEMLAVQLQKGPEKHGTALQTMNRRNAYRDWLQEHVDSLMYGTQLYLEALQFLQVTVSSTELLRQVIRYMNGESVDSGELVHEIDAYLGEATRCIERSGLNDSPNKRPV